MNARISDNTISDVFKKALKKKDLINESDTALIFYDLSYLKKRVENLIDLFPDSTLHAIAIKANPLIKILKQVGEMGVGLEAATLPELHIAKSSDVKPERIVFDSPAKTLEEIHYALNNGCHINADSLYELDRINSLIESKPTDSNIGVRINPQVGSGKIASTSVAGEYSKFGVPILENRDELIKRYLNYEWLNSVHVHVGSQGCSVEMLLDGIDIVFSFVKEVNKLLEKKGKGRKISIFDMGGGLPVSYHKGIESISLSDYVDKMREQFNELFDGNFKLITEFGRYIHANTGWVASKVEYVKRDKKVNTAMIHVGADLFLRKCYRPDDWHHEVIILDKHGNPKKGTDVNKYTIAGPLCFAGDIIANNLELPIVEEGDYLIIQDTGAYTLSMWSRYNSRQIPKVITYNDDGATFEIIKDRESIDNIIKFWN